MANVRSTIIWLLERDKCEQNIPPRRTRRSLIRADVHFHTTHAHTETQRPVTPIDPPILPSFAPSAPLFHPSNSSGCLAKVSLVDQPPIWQGSSLPPGLGDGLTPQIADTFDNFPLILSAPKACRKNCLRHNVRAMP